MMLWRSGTIVCEQARWGEAVEYLVELEEGTQARALAYRPQVGEAAKGERVLLSASAVARGLGTGGYMFVVAFPDRLPADPPPQAGHIMKARYTPSQYMVQGVDEQESEYHEVLENARSIEGMQVIAADLHSAVPAIAHTIHTLRPELRIAYVMNDGGALPAWFSRAGAMLREQGLILGTITTGQAYGGELEAVNIYTGLLAARHVWNADIAIVAQGPGNLGTGTRWGFSGVNVGEALNAAAILGGSPIAALRASNADARGRHFGISHHTMRVLLDIVTAQTTVPIPVWSDNDELSRTLAADAEFVAAFDRAADELRERSHLIIEHIPTDGLSEILRECSVPLRTMGRSLEADASSFLAAAVSGIYAVRHAQ